MKKSFKRGARGVSVIEVLIVVGIIGIAMALLAKLTLAGLGAWEKQWARVKMEKQAQTFMYVLSYNLRQAQPGTVAITNNPGEMNNSLITFTLVGQSKPVSFYLRTLKSGSKIMERQAVFVEAKGNTTTPTYAPQVLATDVLSLYFTYPKIADITRVAANISLYATPLNRKDPVFFQSQETIYIRN
jgi:type II secretory pathway pseudopilin PulG